MMGTICIITKICVCWICSYMYNRAWLFGNMHVRFVCICMYIRVRGVWECEYARKYLCARVSVWENDSMCVREWMWLFWGSVLCLTDYLLVKRESCLSLLEWFYGHDLYDLKPQYSHWTEPSVLSTCTSFHSQAKFLLTAQVPLTSYVSTHIA